MPDFQLKRDESRLVTCREGGLFAVALDGPVGEALHVVIGMQDPKDGDLLVRHLEPDEADDVARQLTEYAAAIRAGK